MIEKVVILYVPGIDPFSLLAPSTHSSTVDLNYPNPQVFELSGSRCQNLQIFTAMPQCASLFSEVVLTKAPGDKGCLLSAFNTFMHIPQKSKNTKNRLPCNLSDLLLSSEEMSSNDYPGSSEEGFMDTKPLSGSFYEALAIDCEMCITKDGLECTRVSIVDLQKKIVYDSLVKPANEIVDYNTRFSGITKEMLHNVQVTLPQVQEKLRYLISAETILIGHSLG